MDAAVDAGIGADEGVGGEARVAVGGLDDPVSGGMRAADGIRAARAYVRVAQGYAFTNADHSTGDTCAAVHLHATADVYEGGKNCDIYYCL